VSRCASAQRGLWGIFRACGRDDQQGKLCADLALGELKDKTTYGQGVADAARAAANAGGKKEAMYQGVNTGENGYSPIVSKIKASGAESLM
jgi:branched-chain amino acid transport system substrate-binding protein